MIGSEKSHQYQTSISSHLISDLYTIFIKKNLNVINKRFIISEKIRNLGNYIYHYVTIFKQSRYTGK